MIVRTASVSPRHPHVTQVRCGGGDVAGSMPDESTEVIRGQTSYRYPPARAPTGITVVAKCVLPGKPTAGLPLVGQWPAAPRQGGIRALGSSRPQSGTLPNRRKLRFAPLAGASPA
jgi:hypothetical protein